MLSSNSDSLSLPPFLSAPQVVSNVLGSVRLAAKFVTKSRLEKLFAIDNPVLVTNEGALYFGLLCPSLFEAVRVYMKEKE